MTTAPDDPQATGSEPSSPSLHKQPRPAGASAPPPGEQPGGYGGPPPGVAPQGHGGPPPGYGPPPGGYDAPPGGYGAPGYGPQTTAYPTAPPRPLGDAEQRQWSLLAHLSGIALWFLGPLVVLLVFRGRGRFVEEQSKEALNFQITHALIQLVGLIAATVVTVVSFGLLAFVYGIIFWLAYLWMAIFSVVAAVAANNGQAYRYPMNLRLVR